MNKNIYINKQFFSLPLINGKSGNSGSVYHLVKDNEDLAVKIYHSSIEEDDYPWYPNENDLVYLTKQYQKISPVVLSKYKVDDSNHTYIGCASPYIYETRGETSDAIWLLPRDTFFDYFYNIIDTIPYFNSKKISLCDWSMNNIILGKTKNIDQEKLFIFDDSDYSVEDKATDNYIEVNNLVEDIIYNYIEDEDSKTKDKILTKVKRNTHYINFLEKYSKSNSNMKEFMDECITQSKKTS